MARAATVDAPCRAGRHRKEQRRGPPVRQLPSTRTSPTDERAGRRLPHRPIDRCAATPTDRAILPFGTRPASFRHRRTRAATRALRDPKGGRMFVYMRRRRSYEMAAGSAVRFRRSDTCSPTDPRTATPRRGRRSPTPTVCGVERPGPNGESETAARDDTDRGDDPPLSPSSRAFNRYSGCRRRFPANNRQPGS
jgi:hypothetical protein